LILLNQNFIISFRSRVSSFFSIALLVLFSIFASFLFPNIAHCYNPGFAWDANTESDLAGYNFYYKNGDSSGPYNGTGADEGDSPINIPLDRLNNPANPQFTIHGLSDTETYSFVITAYDTTGNESGFSNELTYISSSSPGNAPPEITITAPDNGSSYNLNDSITFSGSAIDSEDGNISNSLSWVSNLDGVIGNGAWFRTSALTAGTHIIMVSAADSGNLVGSATLTLTVLSPSLNTPPEVTITAPDNGSSYNLNDSITFSGSAIDSEDGNISNSLTWVSNLDGVVGRGATFSTSSLSAGTHIIMVSATDSGNLAGSATITLTVLSSTTSSAVDESPVPSGNLALGQPTAASSQEGADVSPKYAVDGKGSTRWSSLYSDPQWIHVDLGAIYPIDHVVLKWETAYGKAYQIQVSTDATTWTTMFSETNGNGGTDDITFASANARYVRVYGMKRGTQWGYSLWEFEVYGATFPSVLTSVKVLPATATVTIGNTQTFTATGLDQYGAEFPTTVDWTVSGGGTIDPASGIFTASTVGGPFTVTAKSTADSTISGTADVTVVDGSSLNYRKFHRFHRN